MKKLIVLALGLAIGCNSSQKTVKTDQTQKQEPNAQTFAETITEADLKTHLYTYASDEFEGRETGKPGQKKAVEYLRESYQKLGVPAAKANGDYFQPVPLEMRNLPTGAITVNGTLYPIGTDLLSFSKATDNIEEIIYLGFGIEEGNYSDYSGWDVNNKWVLVKSGEPINADGTYQLTGTSKKSVWSNMSESIGKRIELAAEKGAKGFILYDANNFNRYKGYYEFMKSNDQGQMAFKEEDGKLTSNLYINAKLAKNIMANIDTDNTPKLIPVKINMNLASTDVNVETENLAAMIKGSEKPNEYVIISSHLDHIGISSSGEINNGADDDGSGTVALLEIAQAFKKAADQGNGPKRSIIFLHVTGEEKGLLGSQYYTDVDPLVPLTQTVADLNIDMIGRIDPKRNGNRNYIYLIGSDKLSTELHELSEEVNKKYTNLELDYTYNDENDPNRFYYRSDHYNFAKKNIPIIFYFNGTHDDYHRPGDTPDKINYDLLQNRTRLIFYTAWELANRDARPIVDKATK